MTLLLFVSIALTVGLVVTTVVHLRFRAAVTPRLARLETETEQLRDAEKFAADGLRFTEAISALPLGVAICDPTGAVVFRNAAAEAFSGRTHGDKLVEASVVDALDEALRGDPATRSLDLFKPPRRSFVITAVPLEDDRQTEGPRAGGAVAVIEEVTEQRRVEEMRRDFVANISHELKTPVGALALLAETLRDEPDEEVSRRLAARVLTEADRVGRTIEDLLMLSRLEVEDLPEREPVAIHHVVAEAAARVAHGADQAGIELVVERIDERLVVDGDRAQLVSALANLVDNAVKYSDVDSVVEISARTDGQTVDIVVRDHGIGIPARDLDRIFERFYRVDQARSRQTGGTGLGLSIVRHVAGNHEGEVLVDSRVGEGSQFTLKLPIGQTPVVVTAEAV